MPAENPFRGSIDQRDHLTPWREPDAAEDVFRSTIEAARIGLWEADMVTRQAWRSPAHAAIFGYAQNEVQPWSVDEFQKHLYPEDKAWVLRSIVDGARSGTGWGFECRIIRKDNAVRWVAIRSAPIPGGSATCRRFRGIVMDITERKVAEMAVQESDRRFALLANSAPVLIWTSGVDKLCDFFNQPWLTFTGRTMDQELGNGWVEGVHPEDIDSCLKTYLSHFNARTPFRMEYRLRRHDGNYRWILDHGVPRHLPDGSFVGFIGSCIDITDQRLDRENALEAARKADLLRTSLEELTAQQRTILDTSPLAIGLVRDRQVVWSNQAYHDLFGYNDEETRGMSTQTFYADATDYERLGSEAYVVLSRGETYTTEVRLRKKGGEIFWCQITGKAISASNPAIGSIWLLKDIEKIRQSEAVFRLHSEMLAHMGEGVVLVSEASGKIVHTNPMFDQMLGYEAGELLGQPVTIVNAPGALSREEIASKIFYELRRHGRWDGDIANQRKDGTVVLCHASVSRFQHSELGDVWMSVHTDITHARQMERALREAKEQYDNLIAHVPCGVQTVLLHPDGTYEFEFVSPRTAELVGVDRDLLYKDATLWLRHAWPEDAVKAGEETARCIATMQPYKWEGRFSVGATTRWLRFEGHPTAQADGNVLWRAFVSDITDQKALEAAQREAAKLTSIGHLAGGMAHEFRACPQRRGFRSRRG